MKKRYTLPVTGAILTMALMATTFGTAFAGTAPEPAAPAIAIAESLRQKPSRKHWLTQHLPKKPSHSANRPTNSATAATCTRSISSSPEKSSMITK